MANVQYVDDDGTYFPVGKTVKNIPAGFYGLVRSPFGFGLKKSEPVSDDLIDISGTPADEVMTDISSFISKKDRYMKAGLTHKRGYLLYGPPGTGKTSIGIMVGQRAVKELNAIVVFIPIAAQLAAAANIMREVEPGRPVVFLMEEVDEMLNDTTALSVLDGELSIAGAVFIAMTNYKSKLPPRIANRPGRFDRVLRVGAIPRSVQIEYVKRLIKRLDEDMPGVAENLVDALTGLTVTMSHLREAFVSHVLMGTDVKTVAERMKRMADSVGSDGDDEDNLDDLEQAVPAVTHMDDISDEPEDEEDVWKECRECYADIPETKSFKHALCLDCSVQKN